MLDVKILKENRDFANIEVDKKRRYGEIIECLGNREMTAKEIANEMYLKRYIPTNERNFTAPRLTELLRNGVVEVVGKRKCLWTNKMVSIFKLRKE